MVALRNQALADIGINRKVYNRIRRRQAELFVLELKQPLQKTIPVHRRKFGTLVNSVGGGVTVRDD